MQTAYERAMPITAKICGLSTSQSVDAAIAGGASHIGMVFFPPSPRHLSTPQAARLAARVPPMIRRVGVFVNPDDATIDEVLASGAVEVLQLHKTSPARCAELRARTGLELWAAIAVKTVMDLAQSRAFLGVADRLLYDAKTPDGASLPGGMGVRFDWALLHGHRHEMPWALSGGLDAENLAQAVSITGATLVDVSSGVESAAGIKDVDKIATFLKAANQL